MRASPNGRDASPLKLTSFNSAVAAIPLLLEYVKTSSPPALAQAAREFEIPQAERVLRSYWEGQSDLSMNDFFARAALQPYACKSARRSGLPVVRASLLRPDVCTRRAMVSRSNWFVRCACGDDRFPARVVPAATSPSESNIASFTAAEFPHMRLLACESCKGYLLVVDLERDPAAIPEVDELAGLPLDLWAVENGYHKLQPNLAGV